MGLCFPSLIIIITLNFISSVYTLEDLLKAEEHPNSGGSPLLQRPSKLSQVFKYMLYSHWYLWTYCTHTATQACLNLTHTISHGVLHISMQRVSRSLKVDCALRVAEIIMGWRVRVRERGGWGSEEKKKRATIQQRLPNRPAWLISPAVKWIMLLQMWPNGLKQSLFSISVSLLPAWDQKPAVGVFTVLLLPVLIIPLD